MHRTSAVTKQAPTHSVTIFSLRSRFRQATLRRSANLRLPPQATSRRCGGPRFQSHQFSGPSVASSLFQHLSHKLKQRRRGGIIRQAEVVVEPGVTGVFGTEQFRRNAGFIEHRAKSLRLGGCRRYYRKPWKQRTVGNGLSVPGGLPTPDRTPDMMRAVRIVRLTGASRTLYLDPAAGSNRLPPDKGLRILKGWVDVDKLFAVWSM